MPHVWKEARHSVCGNLSVIQNHPLSSFLFFSFLRIVSLSPPYKYLISFAFSLSQHIILIHIFLLLFLLLSQTPTTTQHTHGVHRSLVLPCFFHIYYSPQLTHQILLLLLPFQS